MNDLTGGTPLKPKEGGLGVIDLDRRPEAQTTALRGRMLRSRGIIQRLR
jgi:hypothetical protein